MYFQLIIYAIVANGLFEFLASASLLKYIDIPDVRDYYLSVFHGAQSPIFERVLGYYSFLNGLIRVFGGMNLYQQTAANIVALSYFSQAAFLASEQFTHKSVNKSQAQYAMGFCVIFGALSLYNYF